MKHSEEHNVRAKPRFLNSTFEMAAELFAVLGDASRLKLLEYLSRGEACVSELAHYSGEGISTISHRLKLLKSTRVVSKRREGKHIYYSLSDGHIKDLVLNALKHSEE